MQQTMRRTFGGSDIGELRLCERAVTRDLRESVDFLVGGLGRFEGLRDGGRDGTGCCGLGRLGHGDHGSGLRCWLANMRA
jgi:hypothetical protein